MSAIKQTQKLTDLTGMAADGSPVKAVARIAFQQSALSMGAVNALCELLLKKGVISQAELGLALEDAYCKQCANLTADQVQIATHLPQ